MTPVSNMLALVFALAAGAFAPAPPAAAPAAPGASAASDARLVLKDVVERVQKRYDGAKDFRARFNQTLTNAAFGRKSSSAGEVLLKKPGRMRWNYQQPDPKMYLSDGTTLWL